MSPRHDDDVAARALGGLLREAGDGAASGADNPDSELERLLTRVGRASEWAPHWRAWAIAAALFALALAAGTVGAEWLRRQSAPLTFSANGVPVREHDVIAADSGRAVDVEFSDGSVFDVEPAARLRVESHTSMGARLTLVQGTTVAHVVHRAKTSWSVAAGPFEVQITGTRFGASWDARSQRLSVELYEGSVQVVGGGFAQPMAVRAGQRLEAGTGRDNWLLTSLDGASTLAGTKSPSPPGAATASASESAPPSEPAVAASAASPRAIPSTSDWPDRLAHADFDGIVREANEFGLERCLSVCAPGDLRMLADSARYLGRHDLAERTLLALRKRSPGEAASAAFLLGRLEETRDPDKALSWYRRCLSEAPTGPYAAEAAAGKMRMLRRTESEQR